MKTKGNQNHIGSSLIHRICILCLKAGFSARIRNWIRSFIAAAVIALVPYTIHKTFKN